MLKLTESERDMLRKFTTIKGIKVRMSDMIFMRNYGELLTSDELHLHRLLILLSYMADLGDLTRVKCILGAALPWVVLGPCQLPWMYNIVDDINKVSSAGDATSTMVLTKKLLVRFRTNVKERRTP